MAIWAGGLQQPAGQEIDLLTGSSRVGVRDAEGR